MAVHIALISFISFLGIAFYGNRKLSSRKNKWFLICSLFSVFLIQALRANSVGKDTLGYWRSFLLIDSIWFDWRTSSWEPFYLFLNRLVGLFTDNPQILLSVCSAIIIFGIGLFVYKNTDNNESAFWSVFFFMATTHYLNSMNLLRQYLAMAFTLQIYWVLKEKESVKKYIIAVLLLVIGSLFHSTAIICFIIILAFTLKRIDKRTIILAGISVVLSFILFESILTFVFQIFPKYMKYLGSYRIEGDGFGEYYIALFLLKLILVALVFKLNPDHKCNEDLYRLAFINIISAGFLVMKINISLALRMGYYFDIFMILLIPKVVERIKHGRCFVYLLLILYGLTCFIHTLDSADRACVPYLFFWQ